MDSAKFKAFAAEKLNLIKMIISVVDMVENIVGKGENAGKWQPQCSLPNQGQFLLFETTLICCLQMLSIWMSPKLCFLVRVNVFNPFQNYKFWTVPNWQSLQMTTLSLMKMAEILQKDRKYCGKSRNCSLRAISPFHTIFSKDFYCRHIKTRDCLGNG